MILYLLRHAIAADRATWHGRDADRPVTTEGKKRMRQIGTALRPIRLTCDRILSSPYARATQTSQILAECLRHKKRIQQESELSPQGHPERFFKSMVRHYPAGSTLWIVGHEPYLSTLASRLIGSRKRLRIDLKKGGLCRIDVEQIQGRRVASLRWLVTPKLLLRI